VPIERLAAGQTFHKTVQSAFLTGLTGASGFRERSWQLVAGGRGRVDLAVEVEGSEQMLVIIEIKATDWDKIPTARLMRNIRRHLRQLQAYLDTAVEEMEAGRWASIAGALLYPARPACAETLTTIETIAGEQAIMVTWYEDVDWQSLLGTFRRPARQPRYADAGLQLFGGTSARSLTSRGPRSTIATLCSRPQRVPKPMNTLRDLKWVYRMRSALCSK
jgi:hypothetical protein